MANEDEKINLIIDAENLSSDELNEAAKDIEGLGAAARKTEKDLKKLEIDSATLDSYDKMGVEVLALQKSVRKAELDFEDLNKALKKNKNATREQREEVKQAKQELDGQKKTLTSVSTEYRKLGKSVKSIQKDSETTADAQKRLATEITSTNKKLATQNKIYDDRIKSLKKKVDAEKESIRSSEKLEEVESKATKSAEKRAKLRAKSFNEKRKEAAETAKLTSSLKKYEKALTELNKEKKAGTITTSAYIKQEEKLRKQYKLTATQAKATRLATEADNKTTASKAKNTDLLTTATRRLAQAYTVLLAAQKSIEVVTESVRGYGELEAAVTKVEKTTGLAREQVIGMADELRELAEDVTPTATNELLRYAEVAGQMGVSSTESILQIVAAADALAVSTDLAGDEAALLTARILGMTGQGVDDIHNLASAMVELGNSTKTSESEIAHMTKEIVTGTRAINFSAEAAAGFGATLKELGQPAERSRSAMSDLTNVILDLANQGGEGLEQLMSITQLTSEEIQKSLGENSEEVTIKFIEGLKRAKEAGVTLKTSLAGVGITSKETNVVIGVLADNTDRLARNVDLSVDAYKAGNKHFEEAAKAYSDQDAVLLRLANKFTTLKTKIGEAFNPTVLEAAEYFGGVMKDNEDAIVEMATRLPDLAEGLVELSGAFSAFTSSLSGEIGLIDRVVGGWTMLFNGLSIGMNGFAQDFIWVQKQIAKGLGATERELLEYDKKWHEVNQNIIRDQNDMLRANRIMTGETTHAYENMVEAIRLNGDAVKSLSEEQQLNIKALSDTKEVSKELNAEYIKATTLIARRRTELKILEQQQTEANEAVKKNKKLNEERAESMRKLSEELAFYVRQQASLEKAKAEGVLTTIEAEKAEKSITEAIKLRQDALLELVQAEKVSNEVVKESKGIAESWIEVDGKRIAMTDLLNQSLDNQTKLNIEQADSLTLLNGEVLKGADLTKHLAEQTQGMVVASEFFTGGINESSEAVRELGIAERELVVTIAELEEKIKGANDKIKEKRALTLDLKKAEEELILIQHRKAVVAEVEISRARELRVMQNEALRQMKQLDFQYRSGAITSAEYAEATKFLKITLQELDKAMGDVIPTSEELADKKRELAQASDEAAESEGKLSNAVRKTGDSTGVAGVLMNHYLETMRRYNQVHDYAGSSTEEMTNRLGELQDELREMNQATMPSSLIGLDNFLYKMEKLTRVAIANEKQTIEQTLKLKDLIKTIDSGSLSMEQLTKATAGADYYFNKLSDNQLDPLRQAIDSARREFESLSDAIDRTFDDVQDRLDRLTGRESDILERKFKREMEELEDLLKQAQETGNDALIRQIRAAMANLRKAQELERKEAAASSSLKDKQDRTQSTTSGTTTTSGEYNVNITLPSGSTKTVTVASQSDADTLVSTLTLLGENNINGVQ